MIANRIFEIIPLSQDLGLQNPKFCLWKIPPSVVPQAMRFLYSGFIYIAKLNRTNKESFKAYLPWEISILVDMHILCATWAANDSCFPKDEIILTTGTESCQMDMNNMKI